MEHIELEKSKAALSRKKTTEKPAASETHDLQTAKLVVLGEMASKLAHEMKGPLTVLAGYSSLLREALDADNKAEATDYAERIEQVTENMHGIIQGLTFYTYDDSQKEMQPFSVSKIIGHTLAICRTKSIPIDVRPVNEKLEINCQPTAISQVLMNLLNNAIDAVSEGHREPWIQVEVVEKRKSVEIIVCDNGDGVPAEIADHIMQPFFTTKEQGQGTGLGLSISAMIMRKHGGELQLDRNGPCTRFIMSLPRN